jgi:meso-butanediol dehydrogenase / (S,S)-butanediol dehydrogenase / diacetyl reductase
VRFEDKNVLVTGGARGIGRAIVEGFLGEGATVFAVDVLAPELDRMSSEQQDPGRVRTHVADLADFDAAAGAATTAIEALGSLDVLVNCAGVMPSGPILDITKELFDHTFAVNARAMLATMQVAARDMIGRGGGAIVNIASANAFKNESPEAAYNASKAAVVALTKAAAHELGHLGIRANCVAPGQTVTAEKGAKTESDPDQARIQREYPRRIPMRRSGRAEEQAAAVLFLASDEASFVNAQTLIVDGGELGGGDWYDEALAPPLPQ